MNPSIPLHVASSRPVRVLVADSSADTRALHRNALQLAGCDVVEAPDGRDALVNALARTPSLVITALHMPLMDGAALCTILRKDRATRDVPILVVTAQGPAEVQRALDAGASSVLLKPTTPDAVISEMRRLLARSAHLREHSMEVLSKAAAQLDASATLLARSKEYHRSTRSNSHVRFTTVTPRTPPPQLICPSCDCPLTYERSHIGGVSDRHAEQWDYYLCCACSGSFQYRQRTRALRSVGCQQVP
jgi:CheY-like chemotaxis protein